MSTEQHERPAKVIEFPREKEPRERTEKEAKEETIRVTKALIKLLTELLASLKK